MANPHKLIGTCADCQNFQAQPNMPMGTCALVGTPAAKIQTQFLRVSQQFGCIDWQQKHLG